MLRLFVDRDALLASLVADWANDCLQVPSDPQKNGEQPAVRQWPSERSSSRCK